MDPKSSDSQIALVPQPQSPLIPSAGPHVQPLEDQQEREEVVRLRAELAETREQLESAQGKIKVCWKVHVN